MADASGPRKKFLIGPIEAFEYDYNVHLFKRIAPTAEWGKESQPVVVIIVRVHRRNWKCRGVGTTKNGWSFGSDEGVDQ
jgi:hypothetical protein